MYDRAGGRGCWCYQIWCVYLWPEELHGTIVGFEHDRAGVDHLLSLGLVESGISAHLMAVDEQGVKSLGRADHDGVGWGAAAVVAEEAYHLLEHPIHGRPSPKSFPGRQEQSATEVADVLEAELLQPHEDVSGAKSHLIVSVYLGESGGQHHDLLCLMRMQKLADLSCLWFDEQISLSSLQNRDIHSHGFLFLAASGSSSCF